MVAASPASSLTSLDVICLWFFLLGICCLTTCAVLLVWGTLSLSLDQHLLPKHLAQSSTQPSLGGHTQPWLQCPTQSSSRSLDMESFILSFLCAYWTSLVVQTVKNPPAIQETRVRSLNQEDPLEKGMATHSSILAWRIPWTEEPGGLQFMGFQRVGHDWMTNTHTNAHTCVHTTSKHHVTVKLQRTSLCLRIFNWNGLGLRNTVKGKPG